MTDAWTHPTAIDTATTWLHAERVALQRENPRDLSSPLVPRITPDGALRALAQYVLCLDAVDRLDAWCPYNLRGSHVAYVTLERNPGYDVEAALVAFVDGGTRPLPDNAPFGEFRGYIGPTLRDPRGTVGVILPERAGAPTGRYSQEAAVRRGTLLNQARAVQHARSVAINAGLAATCAANWAAARALVLAQAQATYPDRGYT